MSRRISDKGTAQRKLDAVLVIGEPLGRPSREKAPQARPAMVIRLAAIKGGVEVDGHDYPP